MSYLVCHFGKFKAGNVGGLQRHNQREFKEHSNKDINDSKSHLNYDLVNRQNINAHQKVHEIIKAQRTSDKAIRKDATVICECLISSDGGFFKGLSQEEQRAFFEKSLSYLSDKLGKSNMVYANVHMDETTPHMHVGFVPMTDGCLSAKKVLNRTFLREIQSDMPEFLKNQRFEIERGVEGSKVSHKSVMDFKKAKLSEINALEKNVNSKIQELKKYKDIVETSLMESRNVENIQGKKNLITKNVTLSEEDYKKLRDIAITGSSNNLAVLQFDNEVKRLKEIIKSDREAIEKIRAEALKMHDYNKQLLEQNKGLTKKVGSLDKELKSLKLDLKRESARIKLANYVTHTVVEQFPETREFIKSKLDENAKKFGLSRNEEKAQDPKPKPKFKDMDFER